MPDRYHMLSTALLDQSSNDIALIMDDESGTVVARRSDDPSVTSVGKPFIPFVNPSHYKWRPIDEIIGAYKTLGTASFNQGGEEYNQSLRDAGVLPPAWPSKAQIEAANRASETSLQTAQRCAIQACKVMDEYTEISPEMYKDKSLEERIKERISTLQAASSAMDLCDTLQHHGTMRHTYHDEARAEIDAVLDRASAGGQDLDESFLTETSWIVQRDRTLVPSFFDTGNGTLILRPKISRHAFAGMDGLPQMPRSGENFPLVPPQGSKEVTELWDIHVTKCTRNDTQSLLRPRLDAYAKYKTELESVASALAANPASSGSTGVGSYFGDHVKLIAKSADDLARQSVERAKDRYRAYWAPNEEPGTAWTDEETKTNLINTNHTLGLLYADASKLSQVAHEIFALSSPSDDGRITLKSDPSAFMTKSKQHIGQAALSGANIDKLSTLMGELGMTGTDVAGIDE